jgi:TATA-box binding protein (TBP) (component of TFIID and TFIIIB)
MINPFENMEQTMQQFNEFSKTVKGDPREQVQNLLNSGDMSQNTLNNIIPMAAWFYKFAGFGK